jgi:hypothetical protein
MKQLCLGALLAAMLCAVNVRAEPIGAASDNDRSISLSGCVVKGKNGGYVLSNVVTSGAERVVYWLDDVKLRREVGRRVLITGELEERGQGEVALESTKAGMLEVDVKYEGQKVTGVLPEVPAPIVAAVTTANAAAVASSVTTAAPAPVGTSGTSGVEGAVGTSGAAAAGITDKELEAPYPIRRVDVKTVSRIGGSCR